MKPVVVLTFANDSDEYLPMLKSESKKLMQVLSSLHDKDVIEIHREESAETDEVIEVFNRFHKRICVFHYAGHANGKQLKLEKDAASAQGLAQLFEQQKENLKLVVLNGCATIDQVQQLIELGVPAVIATSSAISDSKAMDFAEWFYRGLSVWRTIQSAFDYAVAALTTKYSGLEAPKVHIYRDLASDTPKKEDQLPWGLYLQPDQEDILSWTLPKMPLPTVVFETKGDFHPNDHLHGILHGMIKFKPSVEESLVDEDGEPIDEREYLDIIIKNFPWTIGAQLQKLVASSGHDDAQSHLARLQQISSTYVISSQLLHYILLSQIWDEVEKDQLQQPLPLADLINIEEEDYLIFDYLDAFKKLLPLLKGKELFIEEFSDFAKDLNNKEHDVFKAYLFLESIKEGLFNQRITVNEAPSFCEEAEYHLACFLNSLAFFVKYRMITVRDIQLVNHRHNKHVEYLHKMGSLNAYTSNRLSLFREPRPYIDQYTNSGSIILVKSLKNVEDYLSLSPFVIDKNTFTDIAQSALNIYIYSFYKNGEYIYHNVNTNIYNQDQHRVGQITTSLEKKKEIKKGIRFSQGFKGTKRTESTLPFALLKTQFEEMTQHFSNAK